MPILTKPISGEFPPYFSLYIDKVPETDVLSFILQQRDVFLAELRALTEAQTLFRYAPGKWSIKETVQHLSDTERIFSYRLLRIARADQTPLPGFDQDPYVANSGADQLPWAKLIAEFAAVREATIALVEHLPQEAWSRLGTASNHTIGVRALAYMVAGHVEHHRQLLRQHPPS